MIVFGTRGLLTNDNSPDLMEQVRLMAESDFREHVRAFNLAQHDAHVDDYHVRRIEEKLLILWVVRQVKEVRRDGWFAC